MVANSKSPTSSTSKIIPDPSPFKSTPVLTPNPKSLIYLKSLSLPSFNPKFTNPGLQLFCTTS